MVYPMAQCKWIWCAKVANGYQHARVNNSLRIVNVSFPKVRCTCDLCSKAMHFFFIVAMCEEGRVYKECSKMPEKSCGDDPEESDPSSSDCLQGCFCPDGQVDNDGKCVPPEKCPADNPSEDAPSLDERIDDQSMEQCTMEGQSFEHGTEIQKECSTCKCESGKWSCVNAGCSARCEALGDPHYKTFDGMRFDFMGKCSYYLLRAKNGVDVIAENGDCPRKCLLKFIRNSYQI